MRYGASALAFVFGVALLGSIAEAQQGNTISVPVSGLRNNNGQVRCGLYSSAATFPKNGQELQGAVASIANQQATCVFNNVAPGTYAVALFHAEKGETALQTSFFGQPLQGYGFSRNATGSMGPPSFSAAAYSYPGGLSTWPVTITYP
jgi:uncharacterized protein (DUF2141 family)